MSDATSREVAMKYLKQICVAVAILLVFYGVVHLLNFLSDLANIPISYYLWILFQIIVAILIIFVGFRIYSVAKTIKLTNVTQLWKEARSQILVLLLGCLTFLPLALYPLPASSSLYLQLSQPNPAHTPISFPYKLDYRWNLQSGGSIRMYTTYEFPRSCQILVDVIPISSGWIILPYGIEVGHALIIGPAMAQIELGTIDNGNYIFKVMMSDTIDVFEVHKTDNKFWLEEVRATRGAVVQKSEFEKRLDGFKVEFIGYPNIDNETKQFVLESIQEKGGAIIDTKSYFEGWSVDVYFYYGSDLSYLRQIITEIAKKHPEYWIRISSNTGWLVQISQYNFAVIVRRPEDADSVMKLILRKGLWIFKQKRVQFFEWKDAVKFYGSSAPLDRTWFELREDLIESISQELGLQYRNDFWVSYGC